MSGVHKCSYIHFVQKPEFSQWWDADIILRKNETNRVKTKVPLDERLLFYDVKLEC